MRDEKPRNDYKTEDQLIRDSLLIHRQIAKLRESESERKKAEREIEAKDHFLNNVFNSIKDGISVLDKDLTIMRVNPTMEEWYSHTMPLVGKKCYEAYHYRTEACDICPSIKTLKTGKDAYEIVPKVGPNKEVVGWIDLYSFPLRDSETGELKGVIEYVRDATDRVKAEEEIRDLAKFPSENPLPVIRISKDGIIIYANKASDPILKHWKRDIKETVPEYWAKVAKEAFDSGQRSIVEAEIRDRIFSFDIMPVREGGYVNLYGRDVTDYKRLIDALKESEGKYRSFVQNFQGIAFRGRMDFVPIFFHGAVEDITGYKEDDFLAGKPRWDQIIYKKDEKIFLNTIRKIKEERNFSTDREYRIVTKRKEIRWVKEYIRNICDKKGKPVLVEGAIHDITDRRLADDELVRLYNELVKSNKKLKRLTLIDSHTGLYNHRYLEEAIEAELYRARRYAHPLSVIMLDIDYFKSINDVYGHQFGDLILKQFSRLLKKMVRRYDILIRFGGEEFIIISPGTANSTAMLMAQRILDNISIHHFGSKKHTVRLKISIAVSSYPDNNVPKGMDLIDLADRVLNKVKEYGGNRVYTTKDMRKTSLPELKKEPESEDIKMLKTKIERLNKRANQSIIEAIFAFAKTIEVKDYYTAEHGEKTVYYATEIAKALRLSAEEIERVKQAATLHDLGKIGISEKILLKKAKLTKKEFETIKRHPQIGVDIIRPIHFLHSIIPLIFYHHERWDGKGYPAGLKGNGIPIGARIIALADVFQALTSDRSYRKAYSVMDSLKIIEKESGYHFDPKIVRAFIKIVKGPKKT